jgi:hypothetical protein
MSIEYKRAFSLFIFILIIAGLSVVYNYPETITKRPQSIHNWRQCDGASLALNYYQEGMHFFKPRTHGLYSDNNTTGYTAPSEIPILYYFTAILYKIFGYHEFIFRALNLLLFFVGLFCVFKLAQSVLNNLFYSVIVLILIFSSPVLVYYADSFLPNTVALSFTFMGWYFFYRFYLNKRTKTFLICALCFLIAGTMKVTELTGPVIILVLLLADRFQIINLKLNINGRLWIKISALLFIFIVVGGWVIYAKYYNRLHGSWQFTTFTGPIWEMSGEEIALTLHKMNVLWLKEYFYPPTLYFLPVCLFIIFLFSKRSDKMLLYSTLSLTLAVIAFSLLWFQYLGDHDYFFIGFYILPAFLFINFFLIIKKVEFPKTAKRIIQIVYIVIAVANVLHARERHHARYYSWMNDYEQMKDMYTIAPRLKNMGITVSDTVIFYPSKYIRPLYLMNLKGWTLADHAEKSAETEALDSILMETYIKNGAKYLITNTIKPAVKNKLLEPYLKHLYARYNSIYIFKIPPQLQNFNLSDTTLTERYD